LARDLVFAIYPWWRSAEEVANALFALMFDGMRAHVVGSIKERPGEGKGTALSVAASDGLNEFAGCFRKPWGVRRCVWRSRLFGGEERPDGGCVVHVVGEEGSELRGESV
jgi:hypothetical protein